MTAPLSSGTVPIEQPFSKLSLSSTPHVTKATKLTKKGPLTITTLPLALVAKIGGYLNDVPPVSKSMMKAFTHPIAFTGKENQEAARLIGNATYLSPFVMPNLEMLTRSNVTQLHLPFFSQVTINLIKSLIDTFPNLSGLDFGLSQGISSRDLAGLEALNCTKISILRFGPGAIERDVLPLIIKNFPNIKTFSIGYTKWPDKRATDLTVLQKLPKLRDLDVSGLMLTRDFIDRLSPELQTLRLHQNQGITDEFIIKLQSLTKLEFLDLCGLKIQGWSLGFLTPGLKKLSLANCFPLDLTEEDLKNLQARSSLEVLSLVGTECTPWLEFLPENLRQLNISSVKTLTDDDIQKLHRYDKLEILILLNNTITNTKGLPPNLKILILGQCENLTNESIEALQHLNKLELLDLTNIEITHLEILPPHLKELRINSASPDIIAFLRKKYPNIVISRDRPSHLYK